MSRFLVFGAVFFACLTLSAVLAGCSQGALSDQARSLHVPHATLQQLRRHPPAANAWQAIAPGGEIIQTPHYRIYTTITSARQCRLIGILLEADYRQFLRLVPGAHPPLPMVGFVFANRAQWAKFTAQTTGANARLYMDLIAGGYAQDGVFATYQFSKPGVLSVAAHEAWHQFSFLALRDRLPAWLDEALATQRETFRWSKHGEATEPTFTPWLNWLRWRSLHEAVAGGSKVLWTLPQLISTQAGAVITEPQPRVMAYYAQIWALGLFLEHSRYRGGLMRLLAAARAGTLVRSLAQSGLNPGDIAAADVRWNAVAGPIYMRQYITPDMATLQSDYLRFVRRLAATWPPVGFEAK